MPDPSERRAITLPHAIALYTGAVLGSGVLVLPTIAANAAGPASLVAWLLLGALSLPLAYMFGALSARYPDAGGIAAFGQRAFGRTAGAIGGWWFLGAVPFGAPIVALTGASYLAPLLTLDRASLFLIAGGMLLVVLLVNFLGIRATALVQVAAAGTIVALLLSIGLGGLSLVRASEFAPFLPYGWASIGRAMALIFWSFVGWEAVSHLAEEFRDPERDVPPSIAASVVAISSLYLLVSLVTIGTGQYGREVEEMIPLSRILAHILGEWAGGVTGLLAFLICLGTAKAYVAGASRLAFALARDGLFPRTLARLHPRYLTPWPAFVGLGAGFLAVLAVMYVFQLTIGQVILIPNASFMATYLLAAAAGVRLLTGAPLQRAAAWIALGSCALILPFAGWSLLATAGISLACVLYLRTSGRHG
ncbi:MAG TPA: amino acid permease [Thermodesulfobacteriota bacterium]|nr:amino acid permease [Thermodesulfobacteriota bacterium]